jgi:hypothetical protein
MTRFPLFRLIFALLLRGYSSCFRFFSVTILQERLEEVVKKHSEFITFPISLYKMSTEMVEVSNTAVVMRICYADVY